MKTFVSCVSPSDCHHDDHIDGSIESSLHCHHSLRPSLLRTQCKMPVTTATTATVLQNQAAIKCGSDTGNNDPTQLCGQLPVRISSVEQKRLSLGSVYHSFLLLFSLSQPKRLLFFSSCFHDVRFFTLSLLFVYVSFSKRRRSMPCESVVAARYVF